MRQGAPVAILSSSAADECIRSIGFSAWSDLCAPFSDVSTKVKDPLSGLAVKSTVAVDFRDLKQQGYLLSLTVLQPTLKEAIGSCENTDDALRCLTSHLQKWVEPVDYETFRTYLACIFIVSASETQPLGEVSRLCQLQHTQQHGSACDPHVLAPSHCAAPKWRTPTTLKHYILVHNALKDNIERGPEQYMSHVNQCPWSPNHLNQLLYRALGVRWTNETFTQLCSTYGAENCQLLKLGNSSGSDLPNLWTSVLKDEQILSRGLVSARTALLAKTASAGGANNVVSPSVSTISAVSSAYTLPETVSPDSQPTSPSSLNSPIKYQVDVSQEDRSELRTMIENYVENNLVPYVERLMRTVVDQLGQRRGIPKSLTAGMKKWFGGNSLPQTTQVSYSLESGEMQSRRLADLLFEMGLYAQAYQQYQSVKKEFAADNAWIHHAAALEMSAYSLFMSNSNINGKQFPIHYLDNALNYFITNNVRWVSIMRCILNSAEVLNSLGMHLEAALQLSKVTSIESDPCVAACLLGAASSFVQAGMHRKAAFYRVLAGRRFSKAEMLPLSIQSYRTALPSYLGGGWRSAESHIEAILCEQSNDPKVALECIRRLLSTLRSVSDEELANQYLLMYARAFKRFGLDSQEPMECDILSADVQNIRTVYGEAPESTGSVSANHTWEDLQRASYHALAGVSSGFQPLSLTADAESDNRMPRKMPAGERFRVVVPLSNPLKMSLTLRSVRLRTTATELKEASERDPFSEVHVLEEIQLRPESRTEVELWVRPSDVVAKFAVDALLFDVFIAETALKTKLSLETRGPKIVVGKNSGTYSSDRRLQVSVCPTDWPLLKVTPHRPPPPTIYTSQAVRLTFQVENIGGEEVTGLCLSTDGTDCVGAGVIEGEGRRPAPSRIFPGCATVRYIPLPVRLSPRESASIFIDVRAPSEAEVEGDVALCLLYIGKGGKYREWRNVLHFTPLPLLKAEARILDPAHGLVSLDLCNVLSPKDVALARIDVLNISASVLVPPSAESGEHRNEAVGVRAVRARAVCVECSQTDSLCFYVFPSVSGNTSDVLWLADQIHDIPVFPSPLPEESCRTPTLYTTVLWKASVVNSDGQVSSVLGESVVKIDFSGVHRLIPHINWNPDEEEQGNEEIESCNREGVLIRCPPIGILNHNFTRNRLYEFPVNILVRNEDLKMRICDVKFKFVPQQTSALTAPQRASDSGWWVDREVFSVKELQPNTEKSVTVNIRVAQPTVYNILGTQITAQADFSDGSIVDVTVPTLVAVVSEQGQ